MSTLLIDNYDSYTFNLFQLIAAASGDEPIVIRNDQLPLEDVMALDFDRVVISPGPGRPERPADFGICAQLIANTDRPLLGVCLGHQGIGHGFGGVVTHAPEPMHGRLTPIFHDGDELFAGIPQGAPVVRYHSLVVKAPLPPDLRQLAWTEDGIIMGLRHQTRPIWGVQFHPESIGTECGVTLLRNFDALASRHNKETAARPSRSVSGRAVSVIPRRPATARSAEAMTYSVVWRKLAHNPDTEACFLRLFAASPTSFWLDSSGEGLSRSRFSFMGDASGPLSSVCTYDVETRQLTVTEGGETHTREGNIFDHLQRGLTERACDAGDLPFHFNGGYVGYLGYEVKADCGGRARHQSAVPDAALMFADRIVAMDQHEGCTYVVALIQGDDRAAADAWFADVEQTIAALGAPPPLPVPEVQEGAPPVEFRLSRSRTTYLADIAECFQRIHDGESYEICLTNHVITEHPIAPLPFYRVLRATNPAPYSAYLKLGGVTIACSSLERFLRIDPNGWVETKPIKGTRRRGKTPEEDQALRVSLSTDEKDRAENLMIVDVLRNDLGVVCEVGTVSVPTFMQVESYATVHQLVTTIRGKLRSGMTPVDCVKSTFPGGSMTGAPKVRTMDIIDELEGEARGVYAGTLGYFALGGAADLNIVIRNAVITDQRTSIGTGGAITALSDPTGEFDEILLKAHALIRAAVITLRGEFTAGNHRIEGAEGV